MSMDRQRNRFPLRTDCVATHRNRLVVGTGCVEGLINAAARRILLSVEELLRRSLFQLLLLKLGLFQPLLNSTSLLLPLRRRSATFTDFPLLTTPWELADDA
ncbi:hypothetical protein HU200_013396 [Digitaria exilis]|uniref:Uncharacterized protein n=1 Tax=Digitaria exilis TaxID=1010633 RepID=A0A835KMF1_9POAL|nr:hypothetical protein HU200_013396 [Digitaria exilis]